MPRWVREMVVVEGRGGEPPFLLDRFEVTNGEFARFLAATGYRWEHRSPADWDPRTGRLRPGREEHPVVQVTLADARAYARWAGKRLPTLREWARAATGRGRAEYPWGDKAPERFYANDLSARLFAPAPVGAFPMSRSLTGAYDLVGNVWEWTVTSPAWWGEETPGAPVFFHGWVWFPRLAAGLDPRPVWGWARVDPVEPLWFPRLAPAWDPAPRRLPRRPRVRVPYVGEGRFVVGGGCRSRVPPNLDPAATAAPVYEALQRGIVTIQLLHPEEWRDDVGFRCVRDLDGETVRSYLEWLRRAPAAEKEGVLEQLLRMGRRRVEPVLAAWPAAAAPELRPWVERLRRDLGL